MSQPLTLKENAYYLLRDKEANEMLIGQCCKTLSGESYFLLCGSDACYYESQFDVIHEISVPGV